MSVNDYSDIFLDVTRGGTEKNLICLHIAEGIDFVKSASIHNTWINIASTEAYAIFQQMLLVADKHGCEIVPTAELAERDGNIAEIWKVQRKSQ